MKMRFATLILAIACTLTPCGLVHSESNDEVAARKVAFSLAGAFTNDGFKLRDGHWCGEIAPGKPKLVQVNLYAGNQYWFSVGATSPAQQLALTVYDEAGKPLPSESYSDESKSAAGFSPSASGPYYIKVEEKAGAPATFCLLYSYK